MAQAMEVLVTLKASTSNTYPTFVCCGSIDERFENLQLALKALKLAKERFKLS